MEWILTRLSEPSTWRGLTLIATSLGVTLSPEMAQAIIAAGLAIVGLINVLRREKQTTQPLPWPKSANPTLTEPTEGPKP